jgi:hypothetical protein
MNLAVKIIETVIRTLLSLALLGTAAYSFSNTYNTYRQEKRAILIVVSSLPVNNGHGVTQSYPVVEISGPDRTLKSIAVNGLFWGEHYEAGDYILVRYNPAIPTGIRVDTWTSNAMIWLFPVAIGILGCAIVPTVKQFKKDLQPKKIP